MKQLQYAKEVVEAEKKKPHVSPRKTEEEEEKPVQQISGRQLVSFVCKFPVVSGYFPFC